VWLIVIALICIDFVSIFYLLAENKYPPTAYSLFGVSLMVLAASVIFFWVSRKIYRMLYTPQIIVLDTVLILGFGEFITNWVDIKRVNISKNDLTIFRRARILRRRWEDIGNIVNKALIRGLERLCGEEYHNHERNRVGLQLIKLWTAAALHAEVQFMCQWFEALKRFSCCLYLPYLFSYNSNKRIQE
jgi:hypothetical protein